MLCYVMLCSPCPLLKVKMNVTKTKTHVSLIYEESGVCDNVDGHEYCQLNGAACADTTSSDCEALRHENQH